VKHFRGSKPYLPRIFAILSEIFNLGKLPGKIDEDKLRYFSGPKLKDVVRGMAKEWGKRIKFDRSRTTTNKYKMCENDGYIKIKTESGKNKLFALTKKGFRHCEEIVNSSYRIASSRNLSKVRVVAISNYLKNTYFLALKEDGSYILGAADNDLKHKGITENSLIEYDKKELDEDFGELPFNCQIEHIDDNSLRILDDDSSIPMTKDIPNTDIINMKVEDELYCIRGKVISRWSPDDDEGVKEIEDTDTGEITIQDSTGMISYIKMPYDSGWREEAIRVGTWVEAIRIFKSKLKIRDDTTITTSLYAPYKVEFFRPLRH